MNKMLFIFLLLKNKISRPYFPKPLIAAIVITCCFTPTFAQKPAAVRPVMKRCGTMEAIQKEMITNPALRARMKQGEIDYQNSLIPGNQMNRPSSPSSLPGPVIIPVVVHIVLPNPWMITDDAVEYFINRLNEDYSGLNADSANGADFFDRRGHSLLRFTLAKRDPAGNFTTGIVRKAGSTPIANDNPQPIKNSATVTGGSTGWDVTKYYNMYVGDGGPAGLLGIAPAIGPGTAASTDGADGVCVDYRSFANLCFSYPEYKLSRTAAHEIGHNFGLYHTFQGACVSADFSQLTSTGCSFPASLLSGADDTPPQSNATSGCPSSGASNGCPSPALKMYQSYMDYTNDACYSMFSKGEVARMEWVLENCRPGYLTTAGGEYPAGMQALDAAINTVVTPGGQDFDESTCSGVSYPFQSCPGVFTPRLRITNAGTTVLTSITVTTSINGINPQAQTFAVNIATGKSKVVSLDEQTSFPGANSLKFSLSAPNGGTDGNTTNDEIVTNFTVVNELALPYTENFASVTFPPDNGSAVINPDAEITWTRTSLAGRPAPGAMRINLFNYNSIGERDIYRTPGIDVSVLDSIKISFYVSHRQYGEAGTQPRHDSLRVVYSPDCGTTWYPTNYAKGGAALSTVGGTTIEDFVPSGSSQWRKESIVLTDFCRKGINNIQIGFESYSDYGNNIYIDSINIAGIPTMNLNAAVIKITEPLSSLCVAGFTPEVIIGNTGHDTLKTLKVKYVIDNSADTVTYNWTGSVANCGREIISLAPANISFGSHTIDVLIEEPNGSADQEIANNKLSKSFSAFTTAETPVFEGFESNVFPSTNWGIRNETGGTTWERSTNAAKTGAGALLLNNPNSNNTNNAVDYFITPIIVNSTSFDSVSVNFDYAYQAGVNVPGSTGFPLDTLEILITTDCGVTFTSAWKKWGDALQTIHDPNYTYNTPFIPKSTEWKSERLFLTAYVNSSNFQLYFVMKGNKQNNLWIDNINIVSQKLPQRLKEQGYLIYPNPFNNSFLIHHSAIEPPVDLKAVQVFNSSGQLLWSKEYQRNAARQMTVDLKNAANGLYILKMIYNNKTVVEKIIKH